jgi:hypothetical protein
MAEQVTGSIGQEAVILNNAASEATLLKLLDAINATSGSSSASKTAKLAGAAGIDPAIVAKANDSVKNFATRTVDAEKTLQNEIEASTKLVEKIDQVNSAFASAASKLVAGSYKSQDLFASFGLLPGPIGIVANAFAALAGYQQQNLETQQSLAKSGAAFGGALTEVRVAAANSFLTLGEFSSAISKNQAILSSMGGSMEAGIKKFVSLQNELLAPGSPTQQNLASLGYSAADAADLTASYMRSQGTMNKESLRDNKAVSAGITEYAQQLDMMTQLTGKSRGELQAKMDKENTEAQWQSALASMSKDKADKLGQGMRLALATGGQGAVDAFKAMALGLPPMTEEGRLYMATQRAGTEALRSYVGTANDASVSTKKAAELNRSVLAKSIAEGANDQKALQKVLQADALAGGKLSKVFADSTAMQTKYIGKTREQIEADLEQMAVKEESAESQAADMDAANKNLQELGQAIIGIINPLVAIVTPAFKFLGGILASVGKWFNSFGDTTKTVISIIGLLTGALTVYFLKQSVQNKETLLKKMLDGGSGLLGSKPSIASAGGSSGALAGVSKMAGKGEAIPSGSGLLGSKPSIASAGGSSGALAGVSKVAGKGEAIPSGSGGGLVGFIKSLGKGLASLAPFAVQMLIGAGAVAGVIAILGAGVAAAIALVGISLPTFAKGLMDFANIDGVNLLKVAAGITALGFAMVAFTAASVIGGLGAIGANIANFFSGGGPIAQIKDSVMALTPILPQLVQIGPAINSYAQGIVAFGKAVNGVDIAKAEQLKKVLSGPTPAETIANAGAQMIKAATSAISGQGSNEEKTRSEISALNSTMTEMLKYLKDTADNTKRTHDATKALNGNLFA